MLTDTALRNLKPKSLTYKVSDRDGMYVTVSPSGTVTFRYDYRLNGRRETLTIGRYGPSGISLAMARELLLEARKTVLQGISPALEKQRDKRRVRAIKTFGAAMETYLTHTKWADSTRAVRKHIIDRDILPVFQNRLLTEIQAEDLRILCNKVKERGAPATAVQIRDIVKQVYVYAIAHGEKVTNPADSVGPSSIATFVPKDRALSPLEIRLMVQQLETVATYPTIKLALRLILLTLVRKSELIHATWDEVNFQNATWTIPKQRMKGRNPHVVYRRHRRVARVLAHAGQSARGALAAARIHRREARRLASREGAAMTAHSTAARTPEAAPHPRSRLRARIVLAGFATVGLAALAWAAFVQPLPRLIYNPSDSVPVGWYRVELLDHRHGLLPHPLPVGSIVLTRLPADAAALAAQRGYLPAHIPLLKRVGAVAPQHVCIVAGQVRIDGVSSAAVLPADRLGRPLSFWRHCRSLAEGELFLLSVTNPASFDSRYFGPVSTSAVIGVAHPVWLETRP